MNATDVLAEARKLGIRLELEGDDIVVSPASRLTPELRAAIREQKPQIVRDLLLRDALAYLAERSAREALAEELVPLEKQVDATHAEGSLEEYRAAIREYVRAGLVSFRDSERRAA